jgi:hypothetical protein
MERRNLLKMIMAATGVAMVGGKAFSYQLGSAVPLSATVFSSDDVILFNDIAEVIIPRTDTPGAKDANVGLMALVLANDCYTINERNALVEGLKTIDKQAQKSFNKPYLLLNTEQKLKTVSQLDKAAKKYNTKQELYYLSVSPFDRNRDIADPIPHFFTLIKQLTLFSFFTSKVGATEVLRFEAIPGKYNGDLDYKKGDRAWAT